MLIKPLYIMNNTTSLLSKALLGLALFFGLITSAQTPDQVQKITSTYNQAYLQDLAAQSLEKSTKEKQAAIEYAKARNLPISYTTKEGSFVDLQRVLPDGTLIYYTTFNVDAAKSTRTNHINIGGSTGYNLDGQNMTAHVWDGGHPRVTHQEYHGPGENNRVTIEDGATQLHYHAAHVVGTITASGVQANAKGMAPRSRVKAYQWDNDLSEATTAASNGMLLSNHSYGYRADQLPDDMFGAYREDARDWDNLMFNTPHYLMVSAAGNDGNVTHYNGQPFQSGYDMLSGHATSKNNLVVANAQDANVDSNGNLISVAISSSSSPGPTDDFRIKPDIAGNGAGVYSTYDNSNTAYNSISGTSMASPNVTGSLLLLQEHYNNINGSFMRAATLKGLALHTADDAGALGPDARFGWGLLNAKRAAETISKNGSEALVQEMALSQGQTITLQVDSDGFNDLMASISWTDRPGTVNNGTNSTTPALVNDLDIRVTKGTTTYYPWRMTSATSNSNDGDNNVDPFERIEVENASGTYTITITHKGTLTGGSQAFSLIVTGLQVECITATTPQDVNLNNITGTTATASWTHIPGALYDLRYREVGSSTWTVVSDIHESNYEITGLEILTEYEVQVRSKCPEGTPSAYSTSVNFTTTDYTYCDSQSNNALSNFHISNVNLNTINHNSAESTYSDFTHISTDLGSGETYTVTITPTADSPTYGTNYAVWIDYNRNGVFESSERVFAVFTNSGETPTGTFTVPDISGSLSTRMRVSLSNSETEQIPGPCNTFTFGEVEDYTINIIGLEPCTRTPDAGIAMVAPISGAPNSSYTVSAQDYTSATDLSFQWQSNTNNQGWQNEGTATTEYNSFAATAPAQIGDIVEWRLVLTCTTSQQSAYSAISTFTTQHNYCIPAFTNNAEPITKVVFAGFDNSSSATIGGSPYEDFTHIVGEVDAEGTYSIILKGNTGGNYTNHFTVFIDWNQNGILDDAGEMYQIGSITNSSGTDSKQATGTIAVPATALGGATRMRVIKNYNASPTNPCGSYGWGQAEDYTVNVTLPISGYVYENGVWTPEDPSGIATATDDIIVINGETAITTDTDVNNLTIHSEATLNIDKVLNLNGDLTIDGSLVFKSNSSGNGELGYVSTTSSITGNATVQNYMSAIRSYRMVSSAVTTSTTIHDNWQEGATSNSDNPNPSFGTHITGSTTDQLNGFDGTISGNPSIFTVNVATQQFEALGNTNTNTLTAGNPYLLFVRGDRSIDLSSNSSLPTEATLRATGALHTGNHTQNFNATASSDIVMFGNPYQSGVNINDVLGASTNVNTNYYYVYDPNGGTRGAYITVLLPDGTNTSGSEANNILQPGQGAQVAVNNVGPVSINFQETHKTPGQPTNTSATGNALSMNGLLSIQLYTTENFNYGGAVHDSFGIIFADGNDNSITNMDAIKPMNFDENLGRNHNETYLSLEHRALPEEAEILPLFIDGYKHNNYILNMNVDGLDEISFYLDDYYTGQSTLINQDNATYSFSIDPAIQESISTDRFAIRIGERLNVDDFESLSDLSLYPNPMTDQLSISNPKNIELNKISIYDITGRLIHTVDLTGMSSEISIDISSLSSATYMVVVYGDNGEVSKIMVKE